MQIFARTSIASCESILALNHLPHPRVRLPPTAQVQRAPNAILGHLEVVCKDRRTLPEQYKCELVPCDRLIGFSQNNLRAQTPVVITSLLPLSKDFRPITGQRLRGEVSESTRERRGTNVLYRISSSNLRGSDYLRKRLNHIRDGKK